jgi:hypothetical protein
MSGSTEELDAMLEEASELALLTALEEASELALLTALEAALEETTATLDSDVWEEAAGTPQLAKGNARHPRAMTRIATFFFIKNLLSLYFYELKTRSALRQSAN